MKEPSEDFREPVELNRRRHENRWRRILRDADWDQHQTVRRWLKLAREVFDKDEDISEVFGKDDDTSRKDSDTPKKAA